MMEKIVDHIQNLNIKEAFAWILALFFITGI